MLRRVTDTRRENFEKLVMDQGLVYNETVLPDGKKVSYWNEGVFYTLTCRGDGSTPPGQCSDVQHVHRGG